MNRHHPPSSSSASTNQHQRDDDDNASVCVLFLFSGADDGWQQSCDWWATTPTTTTTATTSSQPFSDHGRSPHPQRPADDLFSCGRKARVLGIFRERWCGWGHECVGKTGRFEILVSRMGPSTSEWGDVGIACVAHVQGIALSCMSGHRSAARIPRSSTILGLRARPSTIVAVTTTIDDRPIASTTIDDHRDSIIVTTPNKRIKHQHNVDTQTQHIDTSKQHYYFIVSVVSCPMQQCCGTTAYT